jgi:Rod binding domain-containing protein
MNEVALKITNADKHLSGTSATKNLSQEEKLKIAKTAKDFESMMTAMMLKSMNQTTEDGMFGEGSFGGDVLDTVFETEMAKQMTKGSGMGIAEVLYKKITNEDLDPAIFYQNLNPAEAVKKTSTEKIEIKTNSEGVDGIQPSSGSLKRLDYYDSIINKASQEYGIDENLIKSVILAESAANSKAVSPVGAKGLMQLMDSTASDLGVENSLDPQQNVMGGAKYLSKMLRQYNGDLDLSLAAYNAGPGAVNKYNGVPPYDETKNYISRIKGYLNYFNG